MFFSTKIGIDLGTSSCLVYVKGRGIVLEEPSVIALKEENGARKVQAIGLEAYEMVGRTPAGMETLFPLEGGVISDFVYTEKMLQYFLEKSVGRWLFKPSVAVCIPCKVTDVERQAIMDTCQRIGAGNVYLVEEPLAAALGAGIDISQPSGVMIVDVGGGTTDVAVLSMGEEVASASIRIAGNQFDEDIQRYLKREYGLLIGKRTAEKIKMTIGCCDIPSWEVTMPVEGRHAVTGLPTQIILSNRDVSEALKESIKALMDAIREVFDKTMPELSSDITQHGILLTGGGSLVSGLDETLRESLHIDTFAAADARRCVIRGLAIYLDQLSSKGREKAPWKR